MTISNVTAGGTVDASWGNSVADLLNALQSVAVVTAATTSLATGAYTALNLSTGTVQSDPESWVSGTKITPTRAGYYLVVAPVRISGATGGAGLELRKNGSNFARFDDGGTSPDWGGVGVAYFNGTTDYCEVALYQNSGGSLNGDGTVTMRWIAPT